MSKVTPFPASNAAPSPAQGRLSLPDFEPGWVWLCGAGPGDPGLLTLHAANAIGQADVIVYDALVGEEVLTLARPGATLEYAGKKGGKPSAKQRDISARLVQLARQGKRVLRLKGGDPFVFGRGGEEALALVAARVPFRVIPGVTSGVGGLGYAGIPATHRETNHAVTFVTGHMAGGAMPDNVNWRAIAEGSPVIVLYMAMKHAGRIADELMRAGRNPDEPAAVIAKATTPDQRVLETTLARLGADIAASGIEPPALIVIGEVVRLRAGLDWLGAMGAGKVLDTDPLQEKSVRDAG